LESTKVGNGFKASEERLFPIIVRVVPSRRREDVLFGRIGAVGVHREWECEDDNDSCAEIESL